MSDHLKFIFVAAGAAVALTVPMGAVAQDWPGKPVRLIVPFPPGGTVDPLARLLGARLSAALGQQFIVDNRPGGSGSIGTALTVKSPPDGYTYVVRVRYPRGESLAHSEHAVRYARRISRR